MSVSHYRLGLSQSKGQNKNREVNKCTNHADVQHMHVKRGEHGKIKQNNTMITSRKSNYPNCMYVRHLGCIIFLFFPAVFLKVAAARDEI